MTGSTASAISAISFGEFLGSLWGNPPLQITTVLILGVILVNGATDAPNAIASLVASGGMELKRAVRMAALFNFAGLTLMTAWNAKVAFTISHMVDFGNSSEKALTALCAALTAIILWASIAWQFGIPTSESHALIAGLTGAAVSIHNGLAGICWQEWGKVLFGLFFSSLLGFGMGWAGGKCLPLFGGLGSGAHGRYKNSMVRAQKAGAAAMAFMHGAQDGQKFMGVFLMGIFLAGGRTFGEEFFDGNFCIPLWMTALCSMVMAAGTMAGGEKIIKTVGMDMVKLEKPQGIASDIAAALCLFFSSRIGVPVSTTHVKTTSIMGVGMAGGIGTVDTAIIKEMFLAWLITFPCCGAIGFLMAEFFQIFA